MSIIQLDTELLDSIIRLPHKQLGEAFAAVVEYANTHERKHLEDPTVNLAFSFMADMVNVSRQRREDKRKFTSPENGRKGGRPKKYRSI